MSQPVAGLTRLDRSLHTPLWAQVADALRTRIRAGEWRVGSQIPTEDQLREAFGVSRIVVRQGILRLESEGLLRRDQGRGTFVRDARLVAGRSSLSSFTEDVLRLGAVGTSRLISATIVPADENAAAALDIDEGTDVVRLRRLRLADSDPMGIQNAHIRADRAPGLDAAYTDGESLYEHLRIRHGIVPEQAEEVYRVGIATKADAALLEISPASPVFIVERVTRDADGPFEFTQSIMRGDHYEIRSVLRSL